MKPWTMNIALSFFASSAMIFPLTGCSTMQCEESSCDQQTQCSSGLKTDHTEKLAAYLTGSFSSYAQSQEDAEFFDIVLHMAPMWIDRTDGPWLYVEQAVAAMPEKPYRQRVYQLSQAGENEYISTVYSFENPLDFAGDYSNQEPLHTLTPDDLTIRQGCAISVSWDEAQQAFIGSTNGQDCQSTLRGSTYATSEVFLHKERLITWDRGFNDDNEQVWGAVKGGYIFDRVQ